MRRLALAGAMAWGLAARAGAADPVPAPVPAPAAEAAPAPAPKPRVLPGTDVVLKSPDGWTLRGKYQAARSSGTPTFVLLHGTGQKKELWHVMARHLSRAGYGWIALDLRGHGESVIGPDGQTRSWRKFKATPKGPNDYADMALDLQAAVAYLAGQGIPEEEIGLIGTDVGGSIALKHAAVHPKAPLVALFSPGMSYQEVTTVNAMRAYKDRPILLVYSELDKNSSKATPILYQFARFAAGDRNATVVSVPRTHGVKLPVNGPVVRRVLAWIASPVKPETPPEEATGDFAVEGSTDSSEEEPPPAELGGSQPRGEGSIQ